MSRKRNYPTEVSRSTRKNKLKTVVCIALTVTISVALSLGCYLLLYSPPAFEKNVQLGVPSPPETATYQEIAAQDGYVIGMSGRISVHNSQADVYLANLEGNNVWIRMTMMDNSENILGQSGIIRPGEYLQTLPISLDLQQYKTAAVVIQIDGYVPDTYESAGSFQIKANLVGE